MERETRFLKCALTPAEVAERADLLAEKVHERGKIEGDKKAAAEEFKDALEANAAELRRLGGAVRTRSEDRAVEVYQHKNHATLTVETIRVDTGEVVETRPMTYDEKQLSLADIAPRGRRPRKGTVLEEAAEKLVDTIANMGGGEVEAAGKKVTIPGKGDAGEVG